MKPTRYASFLLLCVLLSMTGCKSNKIILPTVNESAADVRLQGKFVWYDLQTTDMTAASNFYDALFGWDFVRTNDLYPQVKTIFHRGKPIGNMFGRDAQPGDSEWVCSISVPEVGVMIEMVEELGGTMIEPPKDMPDRGRQAVVQDAQGARFAMLFSSTGDPADGPFAANRWMGGELWTTDTAKATRFYTELAQYKASPVDARTGMPYTLLTTKGRPRATINAVPNQSIRPQWMPLVMVDDISHVLSLVEKNGGTIMLSPKPSFRQGREAIIRDPSGATIAILQAQ